MVIGKAKNFKAGVRMDEERPAGFQGKLRDDSHEKIGHTRWLGHSVALQGVLRALDGSGVICGHACWVYTG